MNYTDEQLKRIFPKLFPDKFRFEKETKSLRKIGDDCSKNNVRDSELLYFCYLIEKNLSNIEREIYIGEIDFNYMEEYEWGYMHLSWQQKIVALAYVKKLSIK
jgi:hypothetical protein